MVNQLWNRIEDEYGYALEEYCDEIQDELAAVESFLDENLAPEKIMEGLSQIINLFLLVVDVDDVYADNCDAESIVREELEAAGIEAAYIESLLSEYDFETGKDRGIQFRSEFA